MYRLKLNYIGLLNLNKNVLATAPQEQLIRRLKYTLIHIAGAAPF